MKFSPLLSRQALKMTSTGNLVTQMTASATLVVERFSEQTAYKQVQFKINDTNSAIFGIHPKTVIYPPDEYLIVYLFNLHINEMKKYKFKFKLSILNLRGDKLFTKEYFGEFDININRHHVSLMPRSTILNGYLFHDLLTLHCEFEVIDLIDENVKSDLDSLSEEFQSLLTDNKLSDSILVVSSDGKEFHVHKNILAVRSPVFSAMFQHDCEEKRLSKVTITDMDVDVCEEMLRYIYTGRVQSLDRYAINLLEVADKYQLDSLKNICEHYLFPNLSSESAANMLMLADLHQAIILKAKCIEYISQNVEQVETTEGWKALNIKLVRELFLYLAKKK